MQYLLERCVGEISVLDEEGHLASIAAVSESELLAVDSITMWKLIEESNGVARNLLKLLSFHKSGECAVKKPPKVGEFYRQLSMVDDGLTGLNNRSWLNTQLPG